METVRLSDHASGTVGGKFKRRSSEKWKWEYATAIAAAWKSAGTCESESSAPSDSQASDASFPSPERPTASEPPHAPIAQPWRPTVVEATKAYLSKCEKREISWVSIVHSVQLRLPPWQSQGFLDGTTTGLIKANTLRFGGMGPNNEAGPTRRAS